MNASLMVRLAKKSDLDRILVIERASFGRDAYDRNLFAEYFHSPDTLFLIVEQMGRLCGYLIACTCGDRAELVSLAIGPEARRQGAASALMDSLFRRLRRRAVRSVSLMVKVTNRAAAPFYRKYGFRRIRRVRGYYEDGSDGWRMVLRFPQPG